MRAGRRRLSLSLALTAGVAAALLGAPAQATAAAGDIVVMRAPGLSPAERDAVRESAAVELVKPLPLPDVELVRAPAGEPEDALAALRADPAVAWAELDQPRHAAAEPLFPLQWGLENLGDSVAGLPTSADADIDAPGAWEVTRGAGVTVAVVDTGIDSGHPDLAGRVSSGVDFVDGDGSPDDENGHGTHVAGTIAAALDGTGIAGVAPEATILPLRALDAQGAGWSSDVAAAFERASSTPRWARS